MVLLFLIKVDLIATTPSSAAVVDGSRRDVWRVSLTPALLKKELSLHGDATDSQPPIAAVSGSGRSARDLAVWAFEPASPSVS